MHEPAERQHEHERGDPEGDDRRGQPRPRRAAVEPQAEREKQHRGDTEEVALGEAADVPRGEDTDLRDDAGGQRDGDGEERADLRRPVALQEEHHERADWHDADEQRRVCRVVDDEPQRVAERVLGLPAGARRRRGR